MQQHTASVEEIVRFRVREFIQEVVEDELEEAIGRSRYARGGEGYRNGHRERRLLTTMGPVTLDVPRARLFGGENGDGEFRSGVLPKSKRLTPNAEALIVAVYLCGASTRKTRTALAEVLGPGVSKSTVSRCLSKLKPDWEAWQRRDLSDEVYPRLILDGLSVSVRMDKTAYRLSILVALGVTPDGRKVVLAMKDMGGESKESWRELLDDMTSRGLEAPELVISDGSKGLLSALSELWPKVLVQRCTVHKERNLLSYLPEKLHAELKADYTGMMYAQSKEEALSLRREFLTKWRSKCPKVARSLEEAGEELFTFLRFPRSQWKSLRTTNAIERLNEEYRRRIKVQGVAPSGESVCLLFWALVASGALTLRRVDGWETLATPPMELDLAA
jgi:putative transposase